MFNFSIDKCTIATDGSFLLSKQSQSQSFISKVDVNGNVLWPFSRSYVTDYVRSLKNNQLISCRASGSYIAVDKLDAQGNVLYSRNLFMSDSSTLNNPKMVELTSGDLMFMGTSLNGVDSVLLIIKTDVNGIPYWNKKIALISNLAAVNKIIEVNANGDVILIGQTALIDVNQYHQPLNYYAKIDSSGALLWQNQKAFGNWQNYPTDIHMLNSNEYVITGYCDISTSFDYNYQFFAYKINDLGDSTNLYITGGPKQDFCLASIVDPTTNNITMIGMEGRGSTFNDLNLSSIKIVTINSSLTSVITDKTYAQTQACGAMNAIYNSDGSLSVIGRKYAYGNPNITQTFFMKIKPDGSL